MEVREEVRLLAAPLAEELGFELVDVEHAVNGRHRVIRVLLDKPSGITIADCAAFSRRLEDCLDMNQTIAGSYQLEVSSPGIERPVKTPEAVARFAGSRVAVTAHEAREGRRHFEGELLPPPAAGAGLGVRTEDGAEHWFDWPELRSARLVVDPWQSMARGSEGRGRHEPRRHGARRGRDAR